jgi:hypothetical protein
MSDIAKCGGFDCPIKESCKRFTSPANEFWQSYFLNPPHYKDENGFRCDMYWGDNAEQLWQELQSIVGTDTSEDHNL